MTTDTHDTTDDAQWEPSAKLSPDLIPPELDYLHNLSFISKLTGTRRLILCALAMNMLSETKQTETAIAERIGVSRQSIYDARQDPLFGQALSMVMRSIIAGKSDIIADMLMTRAQKSDQILIVLAKIAELFTPTQRNMNINASLQVNEASVGTPQQTIDSVLQLFMGIGYDLQSFLDLSTERWTQLKSEGL